MRNLRATPDFIQYYEQRITRKLAEGNKTLDRAFTAYARQYTREITGRYSITPDDIEEHTDAAWTFWIEAQAMACINKHEDADFMAVAAIAKRAGLSLFQMLTILQRNNISVLLLAEVGASNCGVRQYVFRKELRRLKLTTWQQQYNEDDIQ